MVTTSTQNCTHTSKQAGKQVDKQAGKQAGKHASRQASKEASNPMSLASILAGPHDSNFAGFLNTVVHAYTLAHNVHLQVHWAVPVLSIAPKCKILSWPMNMDAIICLFFHTPKSATSLGHNLQLHWAVPVSSTA